MNQNWRERFLRFAPLALWIGVVLFASTTSASASKTSAIIRPILEVLFPNAPEENLLAYHSFIRKSAHFIEYAILAFWAARAFSGSAQNFLRKRFYIVSLLLVVLVATIDETNQSFNPTRTGSPWDVLLDASGGAAMLLVYLAVGKISAAKRQR